MALPLKDTISFSSIGLYRQCPYRYKLSKIDGLTTIFDADPSNALVIGRAFHRGIETDAETAIKEYYSEYSVIDDKHINEAIKLEYIISKAKKLLPDGLHEVKIEVDNYVGYIDLLVPVGENEYDLYDFKYSNNIKNYLESGQLHIYKYYFERAHPDKQIRNLYYLFAPKVQIRQKNSETLEQFRERLKATLADKQCSITQVEYNSDKVVEFFNQAEDCLYATEYPKNETRLCAWCPFEDYCKKGVDYMVELPKNERSERPENSRKKIYIYGAPFTGKSYLANSFPDVLFLSTDGNYTNFPNGVPPHIDIVDIVKEEGRITKRTPAWEVFKDIVTELEKKNNPYKTIVVDLVEDLNEHCRIYMYAKLGIQHESDSGFGKGWDMIKKEFLDTMKRLMALNYENIILISHEDATKDITKKGGDKITSVKPAIGEKISNKLAGMVDLVARTTVDNGNYQLSFKTDEFMFGGGRLNISNVKNVPSSYETIRNLYNNLNTK